MLMDIQIYEEPIKATVKKDPFALSAFSQKYVNSLRGSGYNSPYKTLGCSVLQSEWYNYFFGCECRAPHATKL